DITVREVMTHRNEMIMIEANLPLKDAVPQMIENGFSRYPVYDKTRDNIIGFALMRDVLIKLVEGKNEEKLANFVKPIIFVTQHKIINDLFKQLQDKQTHMGIVVNDHGEVVGLVTVEDLLEELVGEIIDESDVKENLIKRIDKNKILVHGRTELRSINRFFHTTLPGKPSDTISSIILKQIKRFPKQGEVVTINRNDLLIVEKTPKELIKIEITKNYD
ncbi:MAG: CBS domain-containing protein, partial [Candidatus Woesebacteria bacterium]|nr:CBS domain-containing protein [Candidatus Woesebacteria bacterium]